MSDSDAGDYGSAAGSDVGMDSEASAQSFDSGGAGDVTRDASAVVDEDAGGDTEGAGDYVVVPCLQGEEGGGDDTQAGIPRRIEALRDMREVGSQAVWSLSGAKPDNGVARLLDDNVRGRVVLAAGI